MRIVQLSFKNINSLAGVHTVRFNEKPLSGTGIFAITGPTGAGKSTLLDAITLAIYNQTPRTGKVSKNAIAEQGVILTRNTDDAFAEVEYQIKGETYRSKWAIRKTRTGNLADYEMELSHYKDGNFKFVDNGLKKGDIPDKNSEIIGLNFDQFVKSILLSQGEFAKFLQAKPKERSELLERITGMGIYKELGIASFEKRKEEEDKLTLIKAGTERLQPRSEEEMSVLKNEQKELSNSATEIDKKLNLYQTEKNIRKNLAEHNEQIIKATTAIRNTEEALQKLNPDLEKLLQHREVYRYKAECEAIFNYEKEELNLQKDVSSSKLAHEKLMPETATLKAEIEKNNVLLKAQEQEIKAWQPKIKQVRDLDKELGNIEVNLKNATKSLQEANNYNQKQIEENNTLKNTIQETEKEINKTGKELEQQAYYDKLPEIVSSLHYVGDSITPVSKEISLALKQNDNWGIKPLLQQMEWEAASRTLLQHQEKIENAINANSIEKSKLLANIDVSLEDYKKELDQILTKLALLKEQFDKKLTCDKNIKEIEKELLKEEAEIKRAQKNSHEQTVALEKLEADLNIQNALKERASLEKKYESDRTKLVDGEPCFLCGSTHHPYSSSHTDSDLVKIESKVKELKDLIEKTAKEKSDINIQIEGAKKLIKARNTDLEKNREELAALQNASNQITTALQIKIDDNDNLILVVKQKEQELERVDKIKQINQTINQLQLDKEQIGNLKSKIDQVIKLKNNANTLLDQYLSLLSDKNNLKQSITELSQVSETYQNKKKQLEKFKSDLISEEKLLKKGEELAKKYQEDISKLQEAVDGFERQKDTLRGKRTLITDIEDIDSFETKLQDGLNYARKQLDQQKIDLAEKEKHLTSLEEHLKASEKRLIEIKNSKNQLLESITPLLNKLQVGDYKEAIKLILPDETVQRIESEQQQLEKSITENKHVLNESNRKVKELKELIRFKEDDQQLEELYLEEKHKAKENQQRSGSIEQILKDEEEKKKQLGEIANQIEVQSKIVDRWRRLQLVIGDAQGVRFTQLAQDLTLVFMLQHANSYLQRLSGRYQLKHDRQKDNQKDDLWIIDQWQGYEERSVQTLSGGESFLVSLALALGLSDLAGKKTKIESLFIDEGFGTLDQSTLEIALDTLQKLQYETNRTIGIISHVPALKERINTQIEILKSASGHSSIRVI